MSALRLTRAPLLASLALCICTCAFAQPVAPLTYSGAPLKLTFPCEIDRLEELGLVCSEDEPCLIYTEFAAIHTEGSRIYLAGNFHTGSATAASLLMESDDLGLTWTEPVARVRMGSLEHIAFSGLANGWISGAVVQSLPRDPFFLVTKDGGKTWRKRPIYNEPVIATLEGFRLDATGTGVAVLTSEGQSQRWLTTNGGDTWQISETSKGKLAAPPFPEPPTDWRVRSDAKLKAHVVEHREGSRFRAVASFLVEAARCTGEAPTSTVPGTQ